MRRACAGPPLATGSPKHRQDQPLASSAHAISVQTSPAVHRTQGKTQQKIGNAPNRDRFPHMPEPDDVAANDAANDNALTDVVTVLPQPAPQVMALPTPALAPQTGNAAQDIQDTQATQDIQDIQDADDADAQAAEIGAPQAAVIATAAA